MATFVNLDDYNIELRDSHWSPQDKYVTSTPTLPEPFLDRVTSPYFIQKDVFRPRHGILVNETTGITIPKPPRRSSRVSLYSDYAPTDDEDETQKWEALAEEEKTAWHAHRLATRPP